MTEQVLSMHLDLNEGSELSIISAAKLLKTRRTGIMFDSIEAALGSKYGRIYGQLIRLISSAIKNTSAFKKADVPKWYAPAA